MSRNLYGYVRGLKIKGDTIEWKKPNIFTHFEDSVFETSVDVGNASYALFDYLDEYGDEIDEIADKELKIRYRIISLSDLQDKLKQEKKSFKKLMKKGSEDLYDELYPQLKLLVDQIIVIADIGEVWSDNLYLKYYIV